MQICWQCLFIPGLVRSLDWKLSKAPKFYSHDLLFISLKTFEDLFYIISWLGGVNLQRPNFFSQKNLIYRRLISELGIRASAATKPQIKTCLDALETFLNKDFFIWVRFWFSADYKNCQMFISLLLTGSCPNINHPNIHISKHLHKYIYIFLYISTIAALKFLL